MKLSSRPIVYTAVFGSNIKLEDPLYTSDKIDYVCFTDQEDLQSKVYEIRKIESPSRKSPVMDAKMVKLLPHTFLGEDKQLVLWIDGHVLVKTKELYEFMIEYGRKGSFWAYKHAHSPTVLDEIQNCIEKGKAPEVLLLEQYDRYKKEGFPDNFPLINGGVILRDIQDPEITTFEESWLKQIQKYSKRDEVSFPYVVWKRGFKYGNFPEGNIFVNPYFEVNREN